MKLFIHRSGRTARAGQKGTSFGFLTTPELPYIHDLSVFVGKKVVDSIEAISNPLGQQKLEISEEARNEDELANQQITLEQLLESPKYICVGKLPQNILDEYTAYHDKLLKQNPSVMKPLLDSI
jgi:ATP-dependent RNA helicase DDX54/DBP10